MSPANIIEAKAWNNGKRDDGGYALRISKDLRLDLPNGNSIQVDLSPSFARKCPEFRRAEIGRWLKSAGHAPWPERKPPKFHLQQLKKDHFKVL